jgi:hypothetical protein
MSFYLTVRLIVDGASAAESAIKTQIKIALFGVARGNEYTLLKNVKNINAGQAQVERFWRTTEDRFRQLLQELASNDPEDIGESLRKDWLAFIRKQALNIFDEDIAPEEAWGDDPKRLVSARAGLSAAFVDNGKVWRQLGLDLVATERKSSKRKEAALA